MHLHTHTNKVKFRHWAERCVHLWIPQPKMDKDNMVSFQRRPSYTHICTHTFPCLNTFIKHVIAYSILLSFMTELFLIFK